jgi:hypothetical protein
MKAKGLAALGLAVTLAGCVTPRKGGGSTSRSDDINQKMASWVGSPMSNMLAEWGTPDRETEIEAGGRLLTYYRDLWNVSDPLPCDDLYSTPNLRGAEIECARRLALTRPVKGQYLFWANQQGILFRWSWKVLG